MKRHSASKEAQDRANAKYKAKTYKRVIFSLRLEEDRDIIESLEQARKQGMSGREWIRAFYYGKNLK